MHKDYMCVCYFGIITNNYSQMVLCFIMYLRFLVLVTTLRTRRNSTRSWCATAPGGAQCRCARRPPWL